MNIYFPLFIPIYILLVIIVFWYASVLAVREIDDDKQTTKISWKGILVVLLGFAVVQYVQYSKQYQYKPYTREEVAKRNSLEIGVWLIVNNDVYDVTDFVKKHPAGPKIILKNAGKDATKHYLYHLEGTKHFWRQAKIGWVVDAESKVWHFIIQHSEIAMMLMEEHPFSNPVNED